MDNIAVFYCTQYIENDVNDEGGKILIAEIIIEVFHQTF